MAEPTRTPCAHQEQFLQLLDAKLKSFIRDSVEAERTIAGPSDLFLARELQTDCWTLMNCKSTSCPSHGSRDRRCWLQVGTLCGGQVQGDTANKIESCFGCEVLQQVTSDPVGGLYENILILVHHLQQKADQIRDMAIVDALTGLYNRRYLDEIAPREMARIQRSGGQMLALVIKLDGHHAGDAVIQAAADVLRGSFRQSDLIFRTGGDEFLVLVCDLIPDVEIPWGQRLDQAAEPWNNTHSADRGYRLAMSVGCAPCAGGQDLFDSIRQADARMHEHKQARRANREA